MFCVPQKGLEQHEGEQMGTEFYFFVIYLRHTRLILHSKMCDKEYYSWKKYCVLSIVGKENKGWPYSDHMTEVSQTCQRCVAEVFTCLLDFKMILVAICNTYPRSQILAITQDAPDKYAVWQYVRKCLSWCLCVNCSHQTLQEAC